jgi:Rps23 Pro-64 3,4-dihydroxylase Tpa1-like proline 4-hydroxylase
MIRLNADPRALAESFRNAEPFPHIVIDGLFDDADLDAVLADFPSADAIRWNSFESSQEKKRGFFHEYSTITPTIRRFLDTLNGFEMLLFLEKLTGIEGLIPDPYFGGGGLHLVENGGFLKVHVDFNVHPKLHLYRRLNLLTYLNKDWQDDFGGHLELWDPTLQHRVHRIAPLFNRTVIFATGEDSYHGHPEPLTVPPGRARQSVSLYYYTAKPGIDVPAHDTKFVEVEK